MNIAQRQSYQESNVLHRAHALIGNGPNFVVGDLVRIKMLTVTPLLRDIKEHHQGWNRNVACALATRQRFFEFTLFISTQIALVKLEIHWKI